MKDDPNPDRVKDPLGQYERNMPLFRNAKPSDSWKLAGQILLTLALVALVLYGIVAAIIR